MRLEESLKKKRFVVTSEIQPPIGTGVQDLVRNVERIRGRVDALTVPELKIEGLVTDTMGTCRALKGAEIRADPSDHLPREEVGLTFRSTSSEPRNQESKISSPSPKITALPEIASRRSCSFMSIRENSSP